MSAKKPTARAARSPRSTAPKAGRPWYAMPPAKGWGGCVLMRRDAAGRSREWACCDSHARAVRLAAALNREGRYARWRDEDLERLRDVDRVAEELRDALRELVDAAARVPVLRDGGRFARTLDRARRVLGDEPVFAPGGEEVAR